MSDTQPATREERFAAIYAAAGLQSRYPFECPVCDKDLESSPSMSMIDGRNSGHGTCPRCKTFLHLEIEGGLKGTRMTAEVFDDYLKRAQKLAPVEDSVHG